jgi:hypothetical protein
LIAALVLLSAVACVTPLAGRLVYEYLFMLTDPDGIAAFAVMVSCLMTEVLSILGISMIYKEL